MPKKRKLNNDSGDDLILNVRVEPRSSRPGIAGPYGDGIKVKLKSPPVDGKANNELIVILAKEYGVPKRDVEIVTGMNSKNKVVRIKRAKP
jgi:uncharacterized protein (TIGR00251 family)